MPVTIYDGRAYLYGTDSQYDIIMVDAYQDITIPFQMSSQEFFTLVKKHLKPGGAMVVNMNMQTKEAGNINDYLQDTIASVFSQVYTIDVPNTSNRELFATNDAQAYGQLSSTLTAVTNPALRTFLQHAAPQLRAYTGEQRILTDDKAPVELFH